jgi:hypothetical protein
MTNVPDSVFGVGARVRRCVPSLALLCALAVLAGAAQAQQDDKAPAFSVQTEFVEVEVHIDPALKADPRLLRVIEEEAKRFVSESHDEAEAEWREDREPFRIGAWSYERDYSLDATAGPWLSVSVLESIYSGGAHPNSYLFTFLWHRGEARRTDAFELLREAREGGPTLKALAALVRDAVIAEKRARNLKAAPDDEWLTGIEPAQDGLGAVGLTPSTIDGKASGLTFHFSPYAVGSYAEGFYIVDVPWQQLEPHLSDTARALFGGEQPETDRERP